jgi:hypothetical protein
MKKTLLFKRMYILTLSVLFTISSVSMSVVITTEVEAAGTCDQEFYSSNDILFYNPCATSCSTGSTSSPATVSKLRGDGNGEKIFNFWVDAGLTTQQAAGITGSMYHESSYSPFRQETSQSWPGGGWGIAQFTGGQRDAATAYVKNGIGDSLFNQFYQSQYGGSVLETNGYIPEGIPESANDKFLLYELNYLLEYIKDFLPSSISARVNGLKNDYNQQVPSNMTLYDYLHSVVQAPDVAYAWTYLYEYPGDIKATALERGNTASEILGLWSNGQSTTCGGNLATGGMTLDQAIKFMEDYKNNSDNVKYIGGAGKECPGGPLSNCVSFSVYFINKYTSITGFDSGAPGNGSTVVANIISRNPNISNGHSPRPYAIFSTPSGSQQCGPVKCGHTGVILGVDTTNNKVIVGEASCGNELSWDTAREYDLSVFDSDQYIYAYTDSLLKGGVQ